MALVLCLAVCEFDVEYGQKIVQSHPASALEPELARKVACLALPDSPSNALLQDLVYCFRLRRCVAQRGLPPQSARARALACVRACVV